MLGAPEPPYEDAVVKVAKEELVAIGVVSMVMDLARGPSVLVMIGDVVASSWGDRPLSHESKLFQAR